MLDRIVHRITLSGDSLRKTRVCKNGGEVKRSPVHAKLIAFADFPGHSGSASSPGVNS